MKAYICIACDDTDDNCTACVPDKTPDDFDIDIMNVFCKNRDHKNPVWFRRIYLIK